MKLTGNFEIDALIKSVRNLQSTKVHASGQERIELQNEIDKRKDEISTLKKTLGVSTSTKKVSASFC